MADNMAGIPFSTPDEGVNYPVRARELVVQESFKLLNGWPVPPLHMHDTYIVSFAYVLGGWKAMISTSRPDGRYYEVTHNANKKETYIDVYTKVSNICIPD